MAPTTLVAISVVAGVLSLPAIIWREDIRIFLRDSWRYGKLAKIRTVREDEDEHQGIPPETEEELDRILNNPPYNRRRR